MKQDTLQSLLDKYREGTLTDSERSELERLSHKDEVFSAARHQATGIIRRRVSLTVTALMICGAGIWALRPGGSDLSPQIAEATAPVPVVPQEVYETVSPSPVTETTPLIAEVHETQRPATVAHKKQPADILPKEKAATTVNPANSPDDPVVMCNNQCDADAVISDIKKFLSV